MNEPPIYEEVPSGPYHFFWLLREDQYRYEDYEPLLGRKDSPVRMPDDILNRLTTGLSWTPSINPSNPAKWGGYGLNTYGPTVINVTGAAIWAQVMRGWAQIFASGPDTLQLPAGYIYIVPGETEKDTEYIQNMTGAAIVFEESENPPQQHRHILAVERDPFVADLRTLAEWGDKAATGEYFILHIGI